MFPQKRDPNMSEIKFRVDDATKSEFEEVCKYRGDTTSKVLRDAMCKYVNEKKPEPFVRVRISRPDGYQDGAWLVSTELPQKLDKLKINKIQFRFPNLKDRRILADEKYRCVFSSDNGCELGGLFVEGSWTGHCYSNGCTENENRTPISEVKMKLEAAINRAIEPYMGDRDSKISV